MAAIAAQRMVLGLLVLAAVQGCSAHRPAAALPVQKAMGATIESQDRALGAALLALRLQPSPENHRRVAAEYRRLRIDDAAFDHLVAATRLDPRDAAAYDGLARIWRDWGFPQIGLSDAARAVFYAPASAAVHNTRGTLLAATGQRAEARRAFETALRLDPGAAFAAANLCYLDKLDGREAAVGDGCMAGTVKAASGR